VDLNLNGTSKNTFQIGAKNALYKLFLAKSLSQSATYTLTLPVNAGTNGYVLQTDGSGVLSWVNPQTLGGSGDWAQSNGESSTTLSTYQTKAELIYNIPVNGDYEVIASCLFSNQRNNVKNFIRLRIDGSNYKEMVQSMSTFNYSSGAYLVYAVNFVKTYSVGNTTIQLQYHSDGGKIMYIKESDILIRKI